ncbi:hypothetical protein BCR44DRAFT_26892 [Catenaria anguillulae PL171]|uniref:Uncharacterized protein n=1 Tax=Catenaria anguillulae PL171 TaxID=765915 RepID=A0A1Y2I371_9FUNG|nr:hypothetical protein BCR44DRAFT_26892 [Catenaria anguillulae PL171]
MTGNERKQSILHDYADSVRTAAAFSPQSRGASISHGRIICNRRPRKQRVGILPPTVIDERQARCLNQKLKILSGSFQSCGCHGSRKDLKQGIPSNNSLIRFLPRLALQDDARRHTSDKSSPVEVLFYRVACPHTSYNPSQMDWTVRRKDGANLDRGKRVFQGPGRRSVATDQNAHNTEHLE